jgi:hypothetical protein
MLWSCSSGNADEVITDAQWEELYCIVDSLYRSRQWNTNNTIVLSQYEWINWIDQSFITKAWDSYALYIHRELYKGEQDKWLLEAKKVEGWNVSANMILLSDGRVEGDIKLGSYDDIVKNIQ